MTGERATHETAITRKPGVGWSNDVTVRIKGMKKEERHGNVCLRSHEGTADAVPVDRRADGDKRRTSLKFDACSVYWK